MKTNKWGPLLNSGTKKLAQTLLENQQKHFERLLRQKPSLYGPYYCDEDGEYITVDDAANPEYVPIVAFYLVDSVLDAPKIITRYVYFPETDVYYKVTKETSVTVSGPLLTEAGVTIIDVKEIDDWIIKEVFTREPKIYEPEKDPLGPFAKFAFPLIRKTYPNLIASNIVSVQPMTGPVGGISFYKTRYANNTKKPV
jgi:hypothetical protein